MTLKVRHQIGHLLQSCLVILCKRPHLGHFPLKILVGKHNGTVHKVTIDGHQFVVVTSLEVSPSEVIIFCLGRISRKHIAQNVLFAGELLQILVQPNCPIPTRRNLIPFEVQEFVSRHIVGENVAPLSLKHGREDDAMENDIILTNEVDKASIRVFPPRLPRLGKKLFCIANVTDGGVKPNVQNLTFGSLHGNGDSPIKVSAHRTGLQSHIDPALTLTVYIALPLFVSIEYPLTKPIFVAIQRKVPMGRLSQLGLCSTDGTLRVDEVSCIKRCTARLTLISIGTGFVAVGASTHDIAVGQKGFCLRVIVLLTRTLYKFMVIVEGTEELRCRLGMHTTRGARVDVEIDPKLLKRLLDERVIAIYHLLRCNALGFGFERDGHSVLVRPPNKQHLLSSHSFVAHVNVRRDIHTGKVTYMHRSIGIRERSCNKGTLKSFCRRVVSHLYLQLYVVVYLVQK